MRKILLSMLGLCGIAMLATAADYKLVTSADELTLNDEYILFWKGKVSNADKTIAMGTWYSTGKYMTAVTDVTVNDDGTITVDETTNPTVQPFTLIAGTTDYSIKIGDNFIGNNKADNNNLTKATAVADATNIKLVSMAANGAATLQFTAKAGSQKNYFQVNTAANQERYSNYKTGSQQNPYFYKKIVEQGDVATPVFSHTGSWLISGTKVTLTSEDGAEIYYTVNGDDPTKESTKYTEPILINDDVTIKAIAYNGELNSNVAEQSYKTYAYSDEANPMTVAEVNALIAKGFNQNDEVYVKGFITSITELSTSYGNATYLINDEAGNAEGAFTVYRGYYIGGEKFTAEDQLAVGDLVIVKGKPFDYNGTNEFASGNELVKIVSAPAAPEAILDMTTSGHVVLGSTLELTCATEGAEIRYTIIGGDLDETDAIYEAPIELNVEGDYMLSFYAMNEAGKTADVELEFTVVAAPGEPTINVEEGQSGDTREFTINVPEGCTVHYRGIAAEEADANGIESAPAREGEEAPFKQYNGGKLTIAQGETLEMYALHNDTGLKSNHVTKSYDEVVTTGVAGIEAENGEVRWFNLQGVEISEPAAGIAIRVQGGKAVKVAK